MYTHSTLRVRAASNASSAPVNSRLGITSTAKRPEVGLQRHRPQALRVHPGHELGDEDPGGDHHVNQQACRQRGAQPSEQVVALADRAGEEKFGSALVEIAQQGAGDEHGDDQHAQQGEDGRGRWRSPLARCGAHCRCCRRSAPHRWRWRRKPAARTGPPSATATANATARAVRNGRTRGSWQRSVRLARWAACLACRRRRWK